MRKSLLGSITSIFLILSFGFATDPWEFQDMVVDFNDTLSAPVAGNFTPGYSPGGMHGVVVAPDGNIWIPIHNGYGETFYNDNGDTLHYKPLYVIDPTTGDHVSFSPITHLSFPDGSLDTLYAESCCNGSGKGISLDNDGNILFTSWSTVYRINYQTGEGMNKFTPYDDMSSMTEATQDAAGNIYVGYVLGASRPVYKLDNDFNLSANAIDTLGHITRSLEISDDGKDIYVGTTWNGFGVVHWHDYGVIPGVTDFQPADTFGVYQDVPAKYAYIGSAVGDSAWIMCSTAEADSVFPEVKLWSSSLDFDDTGLLWAGALTAAWGGPMGGRYYALDPSTGAIIDTAGIQHGDSLIGGTDGPRGAFFDGRNDLYLADFYTNTVTHWYNADPVGLTIEEPGDKPIIAEGFRLEQNYPNPFNPATTIEFSLDHTDFINLSIYDLKGVHVITLAKGKHDAGTHSIIWNGKNKHGQKVASGTYLYRLRTRDISFTKQMVLMK